MERLKNTLRCYGLLVVVSLYALVLVVLHRSGRFPQAAPHDLSQAVSRAVTVEGRIVGFPSTRWEQTRFVVEGRVLSNPFHGKTCVTLRFPARHLAPGDQIRVRGWLYAPKTSKVPGTFDEEGYWKAHGIFVLMRVWDWEALELLRRPRFSLERAAFQFHHAFRRFWEARLAPDAAALLLGITIGAREGLSKELKNACIRAGIYHMVVVSGQNVGMVVLCGMFVSSLVGIPRRRLLGVCAGPLIFYALAVGTDPPVLRATVMALVALLAAGLGRDTIPWYPLVWAAGVLLLIDPAQLVGASFQLSFIATASLLVALPWSERITQKRHWAWRWLLRAGLLTLAVQIGLWPILAHYFGTLSLAGLPANIVLFPFCTAILLVGLLMGTGGVLAPAWIPEFLIKGMEVFLNWSVAVIHFFAGWDWAMISVSRPSFWMACAYYTVLCGILWVVHFYGKTHPTNPGSRLQP